MILGIDQGTTGTTAVVLSHKGKVLGRATTPVKQFFPEPGWVEHDPRNIWKTVETSVVSALRKARVNPKKISCIGLTNQRETVSLFRGSEPMHRFIVWQDRRTSSFCDQLQKNEESIIKIAGTPVDPYFSSSKIRWLLEALQIEQTSSTMRFRTIDSFLIYQMTGADVMEATNASRTSLMDLDSCTWSDELFEIYGIPRSLAPRIIPSQNSELRTKGLKFLPDGIPVSACLGDQQAALFGQCGWNEGSGKITYGTGSFILLNTGKNSVRSKSKLVSTLGLQWQNGEKYFALEGSVFICGAWIQWLRDGLKMIRSSSDSETLAKKTKDSGGVFVVPALTGMGAPFWKADARGAILGLTRGSSEEHVALASLEALAFQNTALIEAMKNDADLKRVEWRVDGGAVSNKLLMQIQSDALSAKIIRPKNLEATATGAAFLAAHQQGIMSLKDIEAAWKLDQVFEPGRFSESRQALYSQWMTTVRRYLH